jgi:hypothetical protein
MYQVKHYDLNHLTLGHIKVSVGKTRGDPNFEAPIRLCSHCGTIRTDEYCHCVAAA